MQLSVNLAAKKGMRTLKKEEKDFVVVYLSIVAIYCAISYLIVKPIFGWLFDFGHNIFLDALRIVIMLHTLGWMIFAIFIVWATVEVVKILDAYLLAPSKIHKLRRGECPLCQGKDCITAIMRKIPTILGAHNDLHQYYVFCEHCQQEIGIDDEFCPKCLGYTKPWAYQRNQTEKQYQSKQENFLIEAYGKECLSCLHIEITKRVYT